MNVWAKRVGLIAVTALLRTELVSAQQGLLDTRAPDPIGPGQVSVEGTVTYAHDAFYPLSGLKGTLWQLPVIRFVVGLSPIADFELSGGPYDRLEINERHDAPLSDVVTATGDTTHAVHDVEVATRIRVVSEDDRRPALGVRFAVRLPNAKHESGMGQDTTDFSALLLAGKTLRSLQLVGNAGVTIMSDPLTAGKQNDVLAYGVSMVQRLSDHTDAMGEISGRWSTRGGVPPVGTESRSTAKLGGRYRTGSFRVEAAILLGLTSLDPSVGLTGGFSYMFHAFSLP
jgi:hypothetical protein